MKQQYRWGSVWACRSFCDKRLFPKTFHTQFVSFQYKRECRIKKKNMSSLKIKVKNCPFLYHLILKKPCLISDELYLEAGNYI